MPTVVTNGSLIPNEVSAPLDARTYCASFSELSKVENAYVGMHIWLQEEGKEVIVTSLKTYEFQHVTVVAVDTVMEVPTHKALSTLTLTKPAGYSHLLIRRSFPNETWQKSIIILDTLNDQSCRHLVRCAHNDVETGVWVRCPEAGFTAEYDGELVSVDLDFLSDLPVNLYYAWYNDDRVLSSWTLTPFPSTGAVSQAAPGTTDPGTTDPGTTDPGTTDPGTTDPGTGTGSTILSLSKPADGLHLVIRQAGEDGTRANSTVIIDTLNDEASRSKVIAYLDAGTDGSWQTITAEGFGSPYDNAAVAVDLAELQDLPATLFYAWSGEGGELADWQSIVFPCSGGGGGSVEFLPAEPLEGNYIDVTADTDGYLVLSTETIPVSVEINDTVYPILEMTREGSSFKIPIAPILTSAGLSEYAGTWRVWRAGGKKGDSGGVFSIQFGYSLPDNPDPETLYLIGY